MGRTWHASCMKCGACQQLIPTAAKLGMGKEDNLPYHLSCYRNKFDPRCMVCHDLLPCGQVHSKQAGMLHASSDVVSHALLDVTPCCFNQIIVLAK